MSHFSFQKKNFNKEFRCAFPNCKTKNKILKRVRNFSRACLRLNRDHVLEFCFIISKLLEETGWFEEKDKIWKKELKPLDMKQRIKKMNFLLETTARSVASQANIQEVITCNTDNEYSGVSEVKYISGNSVAIQVDIRKINAYVDSKYSTNSAAKDTSQNECTNKEDSHEVCSSNIDNEANLQINTKATFSDEEKMEAVDQILSTTLNNFQVDSKISDYQGLSSIKSELPDQTFCDNLHLLQDMFGRIVVEHCQKNLARRLLHMENVMKALKNDVKYERKYTQK